MRGVFSKLLDGRNEPVPELGNCFDVPGIVGRVAQRRAQLLDCAVEAVFEVDECIAIPKLGAHLFARDDFARAVEQHFQDGEGLTGEAHPYAVLAQLPRRQIYFENSELVTEATAHIGRESPSKKPEAPRTTCRDTAYAFRYVSLYQGVARSARIHHGSIVQSSLLTQSQASLDAHVSQSAWLEKSKIANIIFFIIHIPFW